MLKYIMFRKILNKKNNKEKMDGTVKWFNKDKGYGFIRGEDGEDYFVHHTTIGEGVFLRENDNVSFETAETERGKQAQNVTIRD